MIGHTSNKKRHKNEEAINSIFALVFSLAIPVKEVKHAKLVEKMRINIHSMPFLTPDANKVPLDKYGG